MAGGVVESESAAEDLSIWHSFRAFPGFRVLFQSTLMTNSSFWMWNIAAGWLALELTDSPFYVGLTSFLGGIPMLVFALPGGVLIDRFDRRTILLAGQIALTVVAAIVAILLVAERLALWHLLAASFASGTAVSFIFPTRNALVANLVPAHNLANAVALNAAGQNATRVIGPALAGPLIATLGTAGTFLTCAAVQVVAMLVTLRLPHAIPASTAARRTLWGSMTEGLLVIWRSEYLTGLVILAIVPTMFLMPYSSLLPVFARDEMRIGSTGLGVLMAANGLGAVCGALAVAGWNRLVRQPGMLVWSAAGFAVIVLAFALTPVPLLAGGLIFLAGAVSAVYMALNNTKIQLSVDDSVRGRVLSVYLLTWGLLPLGTLPAGTVADVYSAPIAVAVMSVLALGLIVLAAFRFPSLNRAEPVAVEAAATADQGTR